MAVNPNFEVLCNTGDPNCQQYTRNNSAAGYPWSAGATTNISGNTPTHVSMILSVPWGNLEAVVVTAAGEFQHWWRSPTGSPTSWTLGADLYSVANLSDGVAGPPSLIQAVSYGETQIGNFELLVPGQSGILHLTRNNSAAGFPWSLGEDSGFGGSAQSVALIQSDYGTPPGPGQVVGGPGNLECVVIGAANDLVHWYRNPATGMWSSSVTITNASGTGQADGVSQNPGAGTGPGIGSAPAFIQPHGGYGSLTHNNFEVVVPVPPWGAYLANYTRDNSQTGGEKWHFTQQFGTGWYPALILSTFGSLELVVSGSGLPSQGLLAHWYRNVAGGNWYQSTVFAPGVNPALPGFIQDAVPPQPIG